MFLTENNLVISFSCDILPEADLKSRQTSKAELSTIVNDLKLFIIFAKAPIKMFNGVLNRSLIMVKYSGHITGCDVLFSYESCLIYEWCCFYSNFEYIFYMILHDNFTWFYMICGAFCDSIKDVFLKNVKNTRGTVLFLVKLQAWNSTPPLVFLGFFKNALLYQMAEAKKSYFTNCTRY